MDLNKNRHVWWCPCTCHALVVDSEWWAEHGELDVCFWAQAPSSKSTLWWRAKGAWKVLRGELPGDGWVEMRRDDVGRLRDHLSGLLDGDA